MTTAAAFIVYKGNSAALVMTVVFARCRVKVTLCHTYVIVGDDAFVHVPCHTPSVYLDLEMA